MRPRSRVRTLGKTLLITVGLAAASGSLAQESTPEGEVPRHDRFVESLDVHLVNVEVHVTRDGLPVDDLLAEDFEILDDGEPVEITHFFRVDEGRSAGSGENPAADESSGEARSRPEMRTSSSLVILVDHFFLSPRGRKRAFDSLSSQLDRLMSGETQVIVVNKGLTLEIALTSTSDPAEVRAVLEQTALQTTANPASETGELIRGIQRVVLMPGDEDGDNVAGQMARSTLDRLRHHSQQVHGRMRSSLDLLAHLVRSLGGVDGRKAVVYVADELPVRPAEFVWRYWFDAFGEQFGPELGVTSPEAAVAEFDVSKELESLIAEASTNRVVFYPTGVGRSIGDVSLATSAQLVGRPGQVQDGLRWLAEGTGGRAVVGRFQGDRFFDRLHQDLTHYYSLAYASPHRGDGEVHRIEVRVRREDLHGVEVRYLTRYRDRSADQRLDARPLAALRFGGEQNPLEVEVTHGEPQEQKGGEFLLPLEVRFPLANLVLLADRKTHNGRVSFRIVALDEKGRTSPPVTLEAPIEISHESLLEALSRKAVFRPLVALRRGRQTVAVEVRDEVGSVSSTVLVEVDVGGRG